MPRNFKLVEVNDKPINYSSEAKSNTPKAAASKCFSTWCKDNKLKGKCAAEITVQEMTQGSKKKQYSYNALRRTNNNTVIINGKPITYKYINVLYSIKNRKRSSRTKSKAKSRNEYADDEDSMTEDSMSEDSMDDESVVNRQMGGTLVEESVRVSQSLLDKIGSLKKKFLPTEEESAREREIKIARMATVSLLNKMDLLPPTKKESVIYKIKNNKLLECFIAKMDEILDDMGNFGIAEILNVCSSNTVSMTLADIKELTVLYKAIIGGEDELVKSVDARLQLMMDIRGEGEGRKKSGGMKGPDKSGPGLKLLLAMAGAVLGIAAAGTAPAVAAGVGLVATASSLVNTGSLPVPGGREWPQWVLGLDAMDRVELAKDVKMTEREAKLLETAATAWRKKGNGNPMISVLNMTPVGSVGTPELPRNPASMWVDHPDGLDHNIMRKAMDDNPGIWPWGTGNWERPGKARLPRAPPP